MNERSLLEINHLRTAQIVIGEGTPLLMLHGWGVNADLLLPLAQRLALVGFRAYLPDLPGFGQTEAPPTGWSVHDYTQWVIAYLDHHQLDRVHLFGHSFGGRLGLVLGADHPERIHKMVLSNSAGIRPPDSATGSFRLRTYRLALQTLQRLHLHTAAHQLRDAYIERYGSPDYKAATGTMRETFVKVVNEDLSAYAARVRPATLLIWGDQDEDTPLWQGEILEQLIPDAGLIVYPGAGHYTYLDKLAESTQVIRHFLQQAT